MAPVFLAFLLCSVVQSQKLIRFTDYPWASSCAGAATEETHVQDECYPFGSRPNLLCSEVPACAACVAAGSEAVDICHAKNIPEPGRAYRKTTCNTTHIATLQYNDSSCTQQFSPATYEKTGERMVLHALGCKEEKGMFGGTPLGYSKWECDVPSTDYIKLENLDEEGGTCSKLAGAPVMFRTACHSVKCGVTDSIACSIKRECTETGWTEHHFGSISEPVTDCSGNAFATLAYDLNFAWSEGDVSKKYIRKSSPTSTMAIDRPRRMTCGGSMLKIGPGCGNGNPTTGSTTSNSVCPIAFLSTIVVAHLLLIWR